MRHARSASKGTFKNQSDHLPGTRHGTQRLRTGAHAGTGYITDSEYQQAKNERNTAFYHGATTEVSAPYLAEMVRKEMLARFGQSAYTGGYEVYTTINSSFQTTANQAVTDGLEEYDHRHGYRGAEAHFDLEEHTHRSLG